MCWRYRTLAGSTFATTKERDRGLDEIGKGVGRGVLLHAMLGLDAETGGLLGLVTGRVWTRSGYARSTPGGLRGSVPDRSRSSAGRLIDFYHGARACQYLSDAAKAITPNAVSQEAWMGAQKDALKSAVLDETLRGPRLPFRSSRSGQRTSAGAAKPSTFQRSPKSIGLSRGSRGLGNDLPIG
jgi:hypothetical protein